MEPPDDPPPSPGTSAPSHPWTILSRLSKAVREQNWVAVVLEVLIVIVGVVIGFQVTAWGQARTDRAKEQTYLLLLAEDLRETETEIAAASASVVPAETAAGAVLRSFYDTSRTPPDTLRARIIGSLRTVTLNAVTGTAEALVATGDLSLIREDSLRSAITLYLRDVEVENETQSEINRLINNVIHALQYERDPSGWWDFVARSGMLSPGDPLYPFPSGPRQSTAQGSDMETFRSDPAMEVAASNLVLYKWSIRGTRERLLAATVALREQVEAEIDP